ncbi:diaminopimelate epimerase [Herbihabitans rhizosphaerae]|uniref:Diaminopimelate epimerase n=1 Tax=Herbihabitans rhizosphaerae TaxID=1872711 RepID=A0A4Q7KCW8_9PSEU|nr:diaminopimelate epimerase [Herbihabitans rhizosphaerae]RZS30573.1 diaminopimelate epimerase [Herbihabitans rhizosphaerae]
MGISFVKGHGTENDFVLLPDPDGQLDLTPERVRALSDRHGGIGADGVLRVVRASQVPDAPEGVTPDVWFMDYRNADGSISEMCGNGVRVFARYLVDSGLAEPGELVVGTRAGDRPVVVHGDGSVTVQMGPATLRGRSSATVGGTAYSGVAVDVGNPHLACIVLGGPDELAGLDLAVPPGHDPVLFPHGVNVEFLAVLDSGDSGDTLRMRVHERGVGETRSCGTGTVAAVTAALHARGDDAGAMTVEVLGGRVSVTVGDGQSTLTGPAVFVAHGEVAPALWG